MREKGNFRKCLKDKRKVSYFCIGIKKGKKSLLLEIYCCCFAMAKKKCWNPFIFMKKQTSIQNIRKKVRIH